MNTEMTAHLQRLGLSRSPFPPTPDSTGYFSSPQLERDQVEIGHRLRTRAGIVLLTGEIGTGKTTFLRRLIKDLEHDGTTVSLVFNTFLQGPDLLAAVLRDFGLAPSGTPAEDIQSLNRFLVQRWQQQVTCVLIIDDAQNLDIASLELLRLLTCLESEQEKLLQIVLAGQPELLTLLARPEIRQLTSRITTHVQLQGLDAAAIGQYVRFRLSAAGAGDDIVIDDDAARVLHAYSAGNQRRIHLIMDRCLYGLYGQQTPRRIGAALVHAAAAESGVRSPAPRRLPPRMAIAASLGLAVASGLTWAVISALPDSHASRPATPAQVLPATSGTTLPARDPACDGNRAADTVTYAIPATTAQPPGIPQSCIQRDGDYWQVSWQPVAGRASTADAPVLALQQALQKVGQYDGRPDGVLGPLTRRAIARLQHAHGLPVTAQVDALTEHLISTLPPFTTASTNTTDVHSHDR